MAAWLAGKRGRRAAHGLSLVLAACAAGLAFYYRQVWLGVLALWCVGISWRRWSAPSEPPILSDAIPLWVSEETEATWRLLFAGDARAASNRAREALKRVPEGDEHDFARSALLELLAWAEIEAGDEDAALRVARGMPREPSELLKARLLVSEGRLAEGIERLEAATRREDSELAVLVLSSVYVRERRPDMVLELARSKRGEPLASATLLVLSAQLFHAADYGPCLELCELAFSRFGLAVFAYNAACACSRMGRVDDGLGWLERAIASGFDERAQLDEDEDIQALRADARFGAIRARVGSSP
jgi:tetratricopeptide (TPR) repeat protein